MTKPTTTIIQGTDGDDFVIHEIPVQMDRSLEGHFSTEERGENGVVVTIKGRGHYIGGWTKDGTGRIEYGAPMVPGPHAFIGASPIAITADYSMSTAAQRERLAQEHRLIVAEPGHVFVLAGTCYKLIDEGRGYYRLTETHDYQIPAKFRSSNDTYVQR